MSLYWLLMGFRYRPAPDELNTIVHSCTRAFKDMLSTHTSCETCSTAAFTPPFVIHLPPLLKHDPTATSLSRHVFYIMQRRHGLMWLLVLLFPDARVLEPPFPTGLGSSVGGPWRTTVSAFQCLATDKLTMPYRSHGLPPWHRPLSYWERVKLGCSSRPEAIHLLSSPCD